MFQLGRHMAAISWVLVISSVQCAVVTNRNRTKTRSPFLVRHSFATDLIDLAFIRCTLRANLGRSAAANLSSTAHWRRPIVFFKLSKTGGTSIASSLVSSCIASGCARETPPCDTTPAGLNSACNSDKIGCKGLLLNDTSTPLVRAMSECARLPLLVNKATIDHFFKHGSLCAVAPRPRDCVLRAPYRKYLIVFRKPAERMVSFLYYFLGDAIVPSKSARLRSVVPSALSAVDMAALLRLAAQPGAGDRGWNVVAQLRNVSLEEYFIVGLTEALPAFKVVVSLKLDLDVEALVACGTKRKNSIPHDATDLSPAARAVLDAAALPELALFERARAIHTKQRRAIPPPLFAATLVRLEKAQERLRACDCGNMVGRL